MSSVLNSIVKNLESLPSSLLKDLAEALGQSKTGKKEILAHRIAHALSQKKKDVKSPSKRRGYEDRQLSSTSPMITSGFPGTPKIYTLPKDFVSESSIDNASISIFKGSDLTSQAQTSLNQLIYNALTQAIKNLASKISYQGMSAYSEWLDTKGAQYNTFSTTVNFYDLDNPTIRNNLQNVVFGKIYGGNGDVTVKLTVAIVCEQSSSCNAYLTSYSVSNDLGFNITG